MPRRTMGRSPGLPSRAELRERIAASWCFFTARFKFRTLLTGHCAHTQATNHARTQAYTHNCARIWLLGSTTTRRVFQWRCRFTLGIKTGQSSGASRAFRSNYCLSEQAEGDGQHSDGIQVVCERPHAAGSKGCASLPSNCSRCGTHRNSVPCGQGCASQVHGACCGTSLLLGTSPYRIGSATIFKVSDANVTTVCVVRFDVQAQAPPQHATSTC